MTGPAPTEVLQHIDQREADFYKKAAKDVEQATGQPTSPQSLKPEDGTALDKIGEEIENLARYAGSNIGEAVGGKTTESDVMHSKGKDVVKIVQKRGSRLGFLNRLGLKKVA